VAHQASCPNATKTAPDSVRGCKCKPGPSFYTFHRGRDGRPVKGARVRDRQVAERSLRKLQVGIDEGRVGQAIAADRTFKEWADDYLEILATSGRRDSTVRAYRPTVNYADAAFGSLPLREIGNAELRRLVQAVRDNGGKDATVSKHLRHVGAMFAAAVAETPPLMPGNPVPKFKKGLRLKVSGGVDPFTDDELVRLWASMERLETESVYVAICKAAVATGARQGELIGASLDDLNLLNGRLEIKHHYDRTSGTLTAPKDGEARTVYLIPAARAVFEAWLKSNEARDGSEPIFPAPRSGGRVNGQYLTRVVENAMEKAKPPIPKAGKEERPRKPFHAFRATFDRLCLEAGRNPMWVQAQLGHSDPRLTLQTYGQWTESALQAEADLVESLGFPV
jgi:integrase